MESIKSRLGDAQGDFTFRDTGQSDMPVIVLGNSLGTDIRLWNEQVSHFKGSYRILAFNYPGHGGPPWDEAVNMQQLATRVAKLIDALDIRTYSYCGVSMGGALGMELALLHSNRMEKLVLSNTASQFGSADFWNHRIDIARTGGLELLVNATIDRWFTQEAALVRPDLVALARKMFLNTTPEGYAQCCAVVRDFDFTHRLPKIEIPTLVLAGTHDLACKPEQARFLAEHIIDAEYAELPTAHLGNLGASTAFNQKIAAFLNPDSENQKQWSFL